MKPETEQALGAFITKLKEAFALLERASIAVGQEAEAITASKKLPSVDPRLVAEICMVFSMAGGIREQAWRIFQLLSLIGAGDGDIWKRAFLRALVDESEDALITCSCGACPKCAAAAEAIAAARAVIQRAETPTQGSSPA